MGLCSWDDEGLTWINVCMVVIWRPVAMNGEYSRDNDFYHKSRACCGMGASYKTTWV